MISKTPNMRLVKPLSKYMEKRVRMFGRSRGANVFQRKSNNQKTIVLGWVPQSKDNLEIYLDLHRILDGWTLVGNTVTFDVAKNGDLQILEDVTFADEGLKWLEIPFDNLIQANDFNSAAYGTDRRNGPQVATFLRPVVMAQPGIGFCRMNADNTKLLYCSYAGMYGRDSITYALLTDAGQLSDVRCIDVRVRNPNYIPTMRVGVMAQFGQTVKVNGERKSSQNTGAWQMYATADGPNVTIDLPNKTADGQRPVFDFVIQGKDEEGAYFQLSEYFDPGEYEIKVTGAANGQEFAIIGQGDPSAFGFTNAERFSIDAAMIHGGTVTYTVTGRGITLLTLTVNSRPTVFANADAWPFEFVEGQQHVTLNPDPNGTGQQFNWELKTELFASQACSYFASTKTTVPGRYPVKSHIAAKLTSIATYYDPIAKTSLPSEYVVSKDVLGTYTVGAIPDENLVEVENPTVLTLIPAGFMWETSDPFSPMYTFANVRFTITNGWVFESQP